MRGLDTRSATLFLLGLLAGVFLLGLARFLATPWPDPPHYHANWAIFIEGERLDLSADEYMEDVAACGSALTPEQRVHMHNGEDAVVHVHDDGVSWSHLLANLGVAAGDDYLILPDGRRLSAEDGATISFVVNGFPVTEIGNRLIASGDRLLISYGSASADELLRGQFAAVPSNAHEYNMRQDPAGCAGAQEAGTLERLRRAFWG